MYGPAHILTLKKGIAEYISSFMGTKDTTFTALSTDGSGLEWLVKIYENKHLKIFVKTIDGTEFMPINNYLEMNELLSRRSYRVSRLPFP